MATPRPLRALCLHGFRTNASLMKLQTAQLEQAFSPGELTFYHLNGPRLSATAADPALERLVPGPYYEWYGPAKVGPGMHFSRQVKFYIGGC